MFFSALNEKINRVAPQTDTNKNPSGRTALWNAAKNGHVKVVQYLLANGANPFLCDREGVSPLACAKNEQIKKMLEQKINRYKQYLEKQGEKNISN